MEKSKESDTDIHKTDEKVCWTILRYLLIVLVFFTLLGVIIYFFSIQKDTIDFTKTTNQVNPTNNNQGDTVTDQSESCSVNSFMLDDGVCDELTNKLRCGYDGGDCCKQNKDSTLCRDCTCHIDFDPQVQAGVLEQNGARIYSVRKRTNFMAQKVVRDLANEETCHALCLDMLPDIDSWVWESSLNNTCTCTKYDSCHARCETLPFTDKDNIKIRTHKDVKYILTGMTIKCAMNYDCFEQEVSYIQGDIIVGGGFDLRVPTHHHCQRECQAHEECKHFTYYSRKFEKNDELIRSCWLLKEALEAFPDPEARGVISGPDFCPEDTEEIHDSDPDTMPKECLGITKILVVAGHPLNVGVQSQVIDLTNPEAICDDMAEFPNQLHNGMSTFGGLIQDPEDPDIELPIVCSNLKCYILSWDGSNRLGLVTSLLVKRTEAAAVRMNSSHLWVVGGQETEEFPYPYNQGPDTSELVSLTKSFASALDEEVNEPGSASDPVTSFNGTVFGQTARGPELPFPNGTKEFCMLELNHSTILVIPKTKSRRFCLDDGTCMDIPIFTLETFFYNKIDEIWSSGPNLTEQIMYPYCGVFKDSITDQQIVIVTHALEGSYAQMWVDGWESFAPTPPLPPNNRVVYCEENPEQYVVKGSGISAMGGYSFIVVGGSGCYIVWTTDFVDLLFRFQCFNLECTWTQMVQKLDNARELTTALGVPDSIANCT